MSEESNTSSLRVVSWLSLVVAILATIAPYAAATVWANGLRAILYESDAELPAATLSFFQIPPLLWTVAASLTLIGLVAKELLIRRVAVKLGINLVTAVAMLVAAFWIFFVLFMPLVGLIEKLSATE